MGLLLVIALWIATGYAGVKMIREASQKRAEPPIPPARVANADGAEKVSQKTSDLAKRGGRKLGKGIGITFGIVLLTWPILLGMWLMSGFSGYMQFGRSLRVRGRARTPEPARGDNWAGAPIDLALPASDRDAIASHWLHAARMEHASVPAFSRLSFQLAALGAPAHLLRATHVAALDEIRHAETCFAIARALTGEPHDAGAIPALAHADTSRVTLTSVALESLIDGCLAEGIAADIATRGAELATEPAITDALAMIARDEATHAELAWNILAWCMTAGGAEVERAVRTHELIASSAVADVTSAVRAHESDTNTLARYGIVGSREIAQLTTARRRAVRDRALAMLDVAPARAAA